MSLFTRRSGFTLVEILIAITIYSILMISVFVIYRESIFANRGLDATRALQTASRDITDRIAKDIRDYGLAPVVSIEAPPFQIASFQNFLKTRNDIHYYLAHDTGVNSFIACDPLRIPNPDIDCRLARTQGGVSEYLTRGDVVLDRLSFDIVPTQESAWVTWGREWLVKIRFRLRLVKDFGIKNPNNRSIDIQTILSEKNYKS